MSQLRSWSTNLSEPYFNAHAFGPECRPVDKHNEFDDQCFYNYSEERMQKAAVCLPNENNTWFPAETCTFDWVKIQLENTHDEDAQVIFCKEVALSVTDHYDKIPEGFRHIFLIRNPYKVLVSRKRKRISKKFIIKISLADSRVPHVDFKI